MNIRFPSLLWVCALSCAAPSARSDEFSSALSALETFSAIASESVLGMIGFYGQPQPPQWLILTGVTGEENVLRESVFSQGKVVAERKFGRKAGQDLPDIPLEMGRLKIDSDAAFTAAEEVARERKVSFDSAHFQLRCREEGAEPVWMLSLLGRAQVSVGVVYISAETGTVLRVNWVENPIEKFAAPEGVTKS
jgi:hypothetical protein